MASFLFHSCCGCFLLGVLFAAKGLQVIFKSLVLLLIALFLLHLLLCQLLLLVLHLWHSACPSGLDGAWNGTTNCIG
jgi:hypothetical protein